MAKLAVNGGAPVRAKSLAWPKWPIHGSDDVKLITEVTKSDRWSFDGPVEWKFAEAFTKYQGAKHGLCCANGTVGIQLALEALGIAAHDEVLVPGMTWQATAAAALDINAVPILVDVEPDTWCIDIAKAEALVTKKTKALIIVHLYGCMPDMTRVQAFCKKHKLFLIEDCAHQHGSFWKGQGVGSFGDAASFSFQESKVLSCGEGGFNTCKTKETFERLYSLRNCGRGYCGDHSNAIQSGNYRLTEWQAAILTGGLNRLDKQVKHRDANAVYLNSLLAQIPGVLPMRRRREVTQQSYFNITWRLDLSKFKKGVTNIKVCKALNAELHVPGYADFEPPYEPLNNCSLYRPQTKPRYKIDAAHWKAINPKRFQLPVCKDAREKTGIAIHHSVLMGTKKDMEDIAKAMAKIAENSSDLV
ncbi:MAG: DegT/DnrJ/EryC1/StrS family aminotransferase [Candidatus Hydrogenedentes bacterium]|nr:DegT/DnrJ/EryC1/StrS family aminotransferase [Candidatus Hydrogenedentota bacterium]